MRSGRGGRAAAAGSPRPPATPQTLSPPFPSPPLPIPACRKQDAELDELGHAVVRIGEVGLAIHDELHSQTAALDALADDVDATGSRLAAAQRKVAVVLQKAGLKAQLAIAGALLVLLVILTLIAFS